MRLLVAYLSCQFVHIPFQLELYRVQPANIAGSLNEGLVQIPKFPCRPYNPVNVLFGCKALPFYLVVKIVEQVNPSSPSSLIHGHQLLQVQ